jgi:putative transposase
MKKSRFSEAKIISVLKLGERGEKVRDLCRELGISDATFYNWKAKSITGRPSTAASR